MAARYGIMIVYEKDTKPARGNRDMYIQDGEMRSKIKDIVDKKIL